MNCAVKSIVNLPLPRQIRAMSSSELNEKITGLRLVHGNFMATPYRNGNKEFVAYLKN